MPANLISARTTGFRVVNAALRFLEAHERLMAIVRSYREAPTQDQAVREARRIERRAAIRARKEARRLLLELTASYRSKLTIEANDGIRRRRLPGEPKPSAYRVERAPRAEQPAANPTVATDVRSGPTTPLEREKPEDDDGIAPV